MNAKIKVREQRKLIEQEISLFTHEKRLEIHQFCCKNGGHFFSNWRTNQKHPVFQVASFSERVCSACGYREVREHNYAQLNVEVSHPESDALGFPGNSPIIDIESGSEVPDA